MIEESWKTPDWDWNWKFWFLNCFEKVWIENLKFDFLEITCWKRFILNIWKIEIYYDMKKWFLFQRDVSSW